MSFYDQVKIFLKQYPVVSYITVGFIGMVLGGWLGMVAAVGITLCVDHLA